MLGSISSLLASGLEHSSEVEVSFAPSQQQFEGVLQKLRTKGTLTHAVTLDASYSVALDKHRNISYRISVPGSHAIIADNKKKDGVTTLQAFLAASTVAGNNFPCIQKIKDKRKSKQIAGTHLTLRISSEDTLTVEQKAKVAGLSKASSRSVLFRLKDRTTLKKLVGSFIVKIDSTIVTSAKNLKDLATAEKTYEIEVEITRNPSAAGPSGTWQVSKEALQ